MYQGVVVVRDLKRWLQSTNKKLKAANRLRQYVVKFMAKKENIEMKLASAKSHMVELGIFNKVL